MVKPSDPARLDLRNLPEGEVELLPMQRVHAHLEAALVSLAALERLAIQQAMTVRQVSHERWWERLVRRPVEAPTYEEVWALRAAIADRLHAVEGLLGLDFAWPEPDLPRRASVTPAPPRASVAPDLDMTKAPRRANG